MLNIYSYTLGLALGLLTVTPVLSLAGVRIGYALILLLGLWRLIAMNVRIPKSAIVMLLWLVPLSYALIIDSVRGSQEGISLFARGTLTLLAAVLLMTNCRDEKSLRRVMLGAVPVVGANAIFAILQYVGFLPAFVVGTIVAGSEGADTVGDVVAIGSLRPSGLQGASHVFAYTMGVWAFIYGWAVIRARQYSTTALALSFVAILLVTAVVFSAQRSVVWLLVPCLFVMLLIRFRRSSWTLIVASALFLAVIIVGDVDLLSDSGAVSRLGNFSGTSGDLQRQQSWQQAWLVISEDPYLGGAFGAYDFGLGIHNGFLNGWARYGLPWLMLVLVGLGAYVFSVLRKRGNLLDQFGSVTLLLLVLANAMFHTTAPAIGDMTVFIAFAFGLMYSAGLLKRKLDVEIPR